eukprot:7236725-Pyramimonas_sp.AAC.1
MALVCIYNTIYNIYTHIPGDEAPWPRAGTTAAHRGTGAPEGPHEAFRKAPAVPKTPPRSPHAPGPCKIPSRRPTRLPKRP